jgi:hypothetical protein
MGDDLTPTLNIGLFTEIDLPFRLTNPVFVNKTDSLKHDLWTVDAAGNTKAGIDCDTGKCLFTATVRDIGEVACTFTGVYSVRFDVVCVEGTEAGKCAVAGKNITVIQKFYISAGNHCPKVSDGVTIGGSLDSYSATEGNGKATSFLNNDEIIFKASISSVQASLESATIVTITLVAKKTLEEYVLYSSSGLPPLTENGTALMVTDDDMNVKSNQTQPVVGNILAPAFSLTMSQAFLQPVAEDGVFFLRVTVEVEYTGLVGNTGGARRLLSIDQPEFSSDDVSVAFSTGGVGGSTVDGGDNADATTTISGVGCTGASMSVALTVLVVLAVVPEL